MKSNQNIADCLSKVRYADKETKSAITKFLRNNNKSLRIKFSENPNSEAITLQNFIDWYNTPHPQKGDIIFFTDRNTKSDVLGIVHEVCYSYYTLSVSYIDNTMILHPKQYTISDFRPANETELIKLQNLFFEHGLGWSNIKGIITRPELQNNVYYRISRLGVNLGGGVYKGKDKDGMVYFYWVKLNNKPVRFCLHELIGKEADFQFDLMNNKDRDIYNKTLWDIYRTWNGYAKRVEPLGLRCKKHQKYFYIDSTWKIVETEEKLNPKDSKRYNRGNYFKSLEIAQDFLTELETIRKNKLMYEKYQNDLPDNI